MREITTHAINPCNEAIKVTAIDGPGPGGASHVYMTVVGEAGKDRAQQAYESYCEQTGWKSLVSGAQLPQWDDLKVDIQNAWRHAAVAVVRDCARHPTLSFQNGPVNENGNGVNGITHEALLAVLIDRLQGFNAGPYKCRENAVALTKLEEALMWLHKRTREREARGVEGTHKV